MGIHLLNRSYLTSFDLFIIDFNLNQSNLFGPLVEVIHSNSPIIQFRQEKIYSLVVNLNLYRLTFGLRLVDMQGKVSSFSYVVVIVPCSDKVTQDYYLDLSFRDLLLLLLI